MAAVSLTLLCNMLQFEDKHHSGLLKMIADQLQCSPADIVDFELNVCDTQDGVIGGMALHVQAFQLLSCNVMYLHVCILALHISMQYVDVCLWCLHTCYACVKAQLLAARCCSVCFKHAQGVGQCSSCQGMLITCGLFWRTHTQIISQCLSACIHFSTY